MPSDGSGQDQRTGFRNVTNSKRAKIEDLNGLKLRVIPNPAFLETFKALGANPLPLSFSELYLALEPKTIDGQENPYSVILSNKFYEVQKFVSGTNHVYVEHHHRQQEILGQATALVKLFASELGGVQKIK